jgi:hypothetical protein
MDAAARPAAYGYTGDFNTGGALMQSQAQPREYRCDRLPANGLPNDSFRTYGYRESASKREDPDETIVRTRPFRFQPCDFCVPFFAGQRYNPMDVPLWLRRCEQCL